MRDINIIWNELTKKNPFYDINAKKLEAECQSKCPRNKTYGWQYSNFGYAVLGDIISNVEGRNYREVANDFLRDDLSMLNTKCSEGISTGLKRKLCAEYV